MTLVERLGIKPLARYENKLTGDMLFSEHEIRVVESHRDAMLKAVIDFIIDLGIRYPSIYTDGPSCEYVERIMTTVEKDIGISWEKIRKLLK